MKTTCPKVCALGSIIKKGKRGLTENEIWCGLFDYYDHWSEVDHRLKKHHSRLSHSAEIFAHDLVNMASFVNEILIWLQPDRIRSGSSVVAVSAMTEAYFISSRCACDALSIPLSYVSCEKPGQAPNSGLRKLISWAKKNPKKVRPEILYFYNYDFEWFWKLRSLRDYLVHMGIHANIHCDGKQFNLWMHSPNEGWVTREPLLPLLAEIYNNLIILANSITEVINKIIPIPEDRYYTSALHGILIPALYKLVEIAPQDSNQI